MCIAGTEPGGPNRCDGDAAAKADAAVQTANRAATAVTVLHSERDRIDDDLEFIRTMQQALSGELTDAREAELLQYADDYRIRKLREQLDTDDTAIPAEPDTPGDWDRRIAEIENNAAADRSEWERWATDARRAQLEGTITPALSFEESREAVRADYEQMCQALGQTPTETGLDDYTRIEVAAANNYDEYGRDVLAGDYVQQWRNEAIECHRGRAKHMDIDEALDTVERRCNSSDLDELIAARDAARTELDAATAEWDKARNAFAATQDPTHLQTQNDARYRLSEANATYLIARQDLDYYKDCTAQYAGRAGELHVEHMPKYEADTLGDATYVGEYEQSSREWLEAKQHGLGGSDVAAALGYDPYERPSAVVDSKLRPITDDEVAEQLQGIHDYTGAAPRGHAWEPVLAKRFADDNPELSVQHTKATWAGDEPWQRVHLDAVMVDRDGTLVGPWESKTASDPADWDNGIPIKHRAQLAQMMDATGTDKAALTVNIDDRETRTYWMRRDEPLDPNDPHKRTYADRKSELGAVWAKVEDARRNPQPKPQKTNNGQFKWVKNPNSVSSIDSNERTARQLAHYRGCSVDEATSLIQSRVDAGETTDNAVRNAYLSYHPRQDPDRRFVVVDFETNGTHAGKHDIIQTGYQVIDGTGTVHEQANTYHDINARLAPTVGVGMQDTHGISYHSIAGRPVFDRSSERRRLKELADDPNVTFVAHNTNFETSFLRGQGINPARVIDTMNLSKKFDHQSTGAKLSDFTRAHGVDYKDAHNAYADVDMTARALVNFWNGR